ncbi:MAG: sodium:solute symporter family protein [Methanomassiliicoccales archaeon]
MVNALIFWSAATVYMVITLALAYLGWKRTKKGEDFLLAGRNVNPFIIGLSYGSTFISTSAIVGFGGVAAMWGMGIIWLVMLNIGVGILIAFIVYGPRVRRMGHKLNAVTFPDLMGKIYDSRLLRSATAVLIIVGMPLYAAAVIIGGSRFLETTLEVDFTYAVIGFTALTAMYVIFGGLLAVMYTDAFQGALMIVGMSAIMIITFWLLGGVTDATVALSNLATDPGIPSNYPMGSQGFTGWTSFPTFDSPLWYVMVTQIIMGVGIGVLAQPQLIVRYMTAKDAKSLNRAIPIGGLFIFLTTGVAYTVGALSNVYFFREENQLAIQLAGNRDAIMPLYINSAMPDFVIVIFLLTLLAAAMSTLSSLFHTMGSAAGTDLWRQVKYSMAKRKGGLKELDEAPSLKVNRIATFLIIIITLILALQLPGDIVAIATAMFMGLCAAAFLPMLTYGLFFKRPSKIAAITSLIVGAIVWFFWAAFIYTKDSVVFELCQTLFDKDSLLGAPWMNVDPLVIAVPASVLALVIGWMIDHVRSENDSVEPQDA